MNTYSKIRTVLYSLLFIAGLSVGTNAYAWWHHGWHHHYGWGGHGYGWTHGYGWSGVGYYGAGCRWVGAHWNRWGVWVPAHRTC